MENQKDFFTVLRLHRDDLPLSSTERNKVTDEQMELIARKYHDAILEGDSAFYLKYLTEHLKD